MGNAGGRGATFRGEHLSTGDREDARMEQEGALWSRHLASPSCIAHLSEQILQACVKGRKYGPGASLSTRGVQA